MRDSQLSAVIEDHAVWLSSGGTAGRRADLRGQNLKFADLRGLDLSSALLSGANLERADLTGADLREAVMVGAKCDLAVLTDADLSKAVMAGASLGHADLTRAILTGANLQRVAGKLVNFSGADLTNAFAIGARLPHANFRSARLVRTRFDEAALHNTDFTAATATDAVFDGAVLTEASLHFSDYGGASFNLASLRDAVISTDQPDLLQAVVSKKQIFRTPQHLQAAISERRWRRISDSRRGLNVMLLVAQWVALIVFAIALSFCVFGGMSDIARTIFDRSISTGSGFAYGAWLATAAAAISVSVASGFLRVHVIRDAVISEALEEAELAPESVQSIEPDIMKDSFRSRLTESIKRAERGD
jgi:uncharacterized protein YjbI with pentapeptide repeats